MRNCRIILVKVADILCKPFYKCLFFFPFCVKIGKHPFYKQVQFLHFRVTKKYRNQDEIVKVKLSNICNYSLVINAGKDFHQMHLLMAGYYEKNILENLLEDLASAEIFIDAGAYIGYHSLMVSSAFPNVQVYAFEPQKEAFKILQKNISLNDKHITVNNCALGSLNEDKQLNVNKYPEQSSLLISDLQITDNYIVPVKRLDDLLDLKSRHIVVKIDTEGFEFEVLKGMSKIIENNNCVIYFEYNPRIYQQQFGEEYSLSLFQFLQEKGYKIFKIEAKGKNKEVFFNSQNLIQRNLMARKII